MAVTNREEFKLYCMRELGFPVVGINVDDDQINDRIDYALQKYYDYHYDGSEKVFIRFQITDTDKLNRYLTVPPNIIGITDILDIGEGDGIDNMFSIRYQIAQNDLYNWTSVSMVPYYMAMQHIQLIQQLLNGKQPIRYNRHTSRLYIDQGWNSLNTGSYIVAVGYKAISPDENPAVWDDQWLKRYATALIKRQWGNNTKKFNGGTLPGGIQYNGQQIYNEADQEIKELEKDLIDSFSIPAADMIG
jgi:hypothetical protein